MAAKAILQQAQQAGRNLLRVNLEADDKQSRRRRSSKNFTDDSPTSPLPSPLASPMSSPDSPRAFRLSTGEDENQNIVDHRGSFGESLSTSPKEDRARRSKQKKISRINPLRNLVKVSVVHSSPVDILKHSPESGTIEVLNIEEITEQKAIKRKGIERRKKNAGGEKSKNFRKRRNRRSKAIQNEGASLWTPIVSFHDM